MFEWPVVVRRYECAGGRSGCRRCGRAGCGSDNVWFAGLRGLWLRQDCSGRLDVTDESDFESVSAGVFADVPEQVLRRAWTRGFGSGSSLPDHRSPVGHDSVGLLLPPGPDLAIPCRHAPTDSSTVTLAQPSIGVSADARHGARDPEGTGCSSSAGPIDDASLRGSVARSLRA
jgi:hypothetical protein